MKTSPDWQFASGTAPARWRRTRAAARAGMILALADAVLLAAAPLSSLYLEVPGMTAFRVFFYALAAGLVLAVAGLLLILFAAIARAGGIGGQGLVMMLPAIAALTAIAAMIGPGRLMSPMIHDVTTDTANPPEFVEAGRQRLPGQNPVEYGGAETAALQERAYPDIQPIHTSLRRDEALDEAVRAVKDLGWEFMNVDYERGIIEAYETTRVFGFVDDVVIRVRRVGSGSRVDVRSASRLGKGDLGENAARIQRFRRAFRG